MCDKPQKRTCSEKSIASRGSEGRPVSKNRSKTSTAESTKRSASVPREEKKKKNCTNEQQQRRGNEQQQRRSQTYICHCSACGGATTLGCPDDLETIEEEQELEVQFALNGAKGSTPCQQCNAGAQQCPGEDPCGEFFDAMRESVEDGVKKSLDGVLSQYFAACMERIESIGSQLERNECLLTKIVADLNDKIAYYGERNAQQFQYLCVRMEHDRCFYQQQQEYFFKKQEQTALESKNNECNSKCRASKSDSLTERGSEDKHKKGRYWDCNLADDNDQSCPGECIPPAVTDDEAPNKNSKSKAPARKGATNGAGTDLAKKPLKK